MLKCLNDKSGFTLIEMIVYVVLVGIISVALFSVIFFVIRANNKIVALARVNSNAQSVMERMTYEITNSKYIYLPTSNFSSSDAQLSLVTEVGASPNEDITFIDFYVENNTVFLREEDGLGPIALTSQDVSVSDLEFVYYKNGSRESVTVSMAIQAKNNAMSDSVIYLVNTVALRSF